MQHNKFNAFLFAAILGGLFQPVQAQVKKDSVVVVDEVVITALGIKSEKKKIGYAVQEVQGSTLVKSREPNANSWPKRRVAWSAAISASR